MGKMGFISVFSVLSFWNSGFLTTGSQFPFLLLFLSSFGGMGFSFFQFEMTTGYLTSLNNKILL